jgi:hypothetical protein
MGSVIGPELAREILDVEIHGSFRNGKLTRYLLIAKPIPNHFQHVYLTRSKFIVNEMLCQSLGDVGRKMPLALVYGSKSLWDLRFRRAFGK